MRRDGSSQGGSLIVAADKRILNGFEATPTMVDWKSYRCKRVVSSYLAGETQAYVETLDMLEFTKVFDSLFLDPWRSLSDVESIFETHHKSPVITDERSLCEALERSESSTRNLTERRTAIEVTAIRQRLEHGFIYTGWGGILTSRWQTDSRNLRRLGSCLRSCLQGDGKSCGTRLARVQER